MDAINTQIAQHCDTSEEVYCSECKANMYEKEFNTDVLECSECDHVLIKDEDWVL